MRSNRVRTAGPHSLAGSAGSALLSPRLWGLLLEGPLAAIPSCAASVCVNQWLLHVLTTTVSLPLITGLFVLPQLSHHWNDVPDS